MTYRLRALAAIAAAMTVAGGLSGCSGSSDGRSAAPAGSSSAGGAAHGSAARSAAGSAGSPADGSPTRAGDDGRESGPRPAEIDPREEPRSTFAMDVDTASFGHAERVIREGGTPDPEDIRPEEFVNAFRQDYPQPPGDGFTVTMDGARLPAAQQDSTGGDVRLLRIGLQTRADDATTRPDAALTFVIDVSGSMGEQGKLDSVKHALHALVDSARPTDSVGVVSFDLDVHVLRPMTPVRERSALHRAVDELQPGSTTNLEGGLVKGYEVARAGFHQGATNRVILLSDGLANVGDTDAAPILRQVKEAAAKQITLLGVGVGSDYGDALMEQLADHGDGFVVYVSDADDARKAFVGTLPAALTVRARDAKVQVTFDARTVTGYRLVGYTDRALAAQDFRDDAVDGGEVFAGHAVTALYTVRLRPGAAGEIAHTQLRWQDPRTGEAVETGKDVAVRALAAPMAEADPRLQLSYVAAWFAERLRRSPSAEGVRGEDLARLADSVANRTEDQAVRDLADDIRRAAV